MNNKRWYKKEVVVILFGNLFLIASILLNMWFGEYLWIRFLLGISVPILLGSYMVAISLYERAEDSNEKPLTCR